MEHGPHAEHLTAVEVVVLQAAALVGEVLQHVVGIADGLVSLGPDVAELLLDVVVGVVVGSHGRHGGGGALQVLRQHLIDAPEQVLAVERGLLQ